MVLTRLIPGSGERLPVVGLGTWQTFDTHPAAERKVAVLVNRPFGGGSLFGRVRGRDLPPWAAEIDCESWGQFFLKFIVAHPAVTCAIPATSKLAHLEDTMGACRGTLPSEGMRRRMADFVAAL